MGVRTATVRFRSALPPRKLNQVADTLSRHPIGTTSETCGLASRRGGADDWYQTKYKDVDKDPNAHPDYTIRGKQLFRRILHSLNKDDTGEEWKQCIPAERRGQILRENHDAPTAGHLGITKTITRLARLYYWPGMFRDAANHVRGCKSCQEYKASQQGTAGKMHATPVERPWQIVAVDLVGPLPRFSIGHAWILAAQDKFTKYTEIKPLRRATATAVTRAIYEGVILRHGTPETLISDNGRQFTSKEFRAMLRDVAAKHRLTPPYTPQCNPEERQNRVIKTMIAQYTGRNQRSWDRLLPEIQFAINTAIHNSTGYSPAFLNYGQEPRAPGAPPTGRINRPPNTTKRLDQLEAARSR